jgi:hypothetical protein
MLRLSIGLEREQLRLVHRRQVVAGCARDSEDLEGSAGLGVQHDREATQGSKSSVVNGAGSAADWAS